MDQEIKSSEFLRGKFIDYFKNKDHTVVPSSSLVSSDPSVLLTSAGMQQFKPYYLEEKSPYGNKVVSIQKCFRTSDIEEVGKTIRHLTFFEMLGNFSFKYGQTPNGGYFKEETIAYAYEFIVKILGLNIDYVTVFKGDLNKKIPSDLESEKIWKRINPNIKIIKMGKEDNFWGPTGLEGPCGPTTEIYINDIEIWNLVFNEYYCDKEGNLRELEFKGVDTGMGLERLAMVVQNKKSVFETDLFSPLMVSISKYQINSLKAKRIIADHLKAACFLIADGVLPSNKEAGYILRRLLRRVIRLERIYNFNKSLYSVLVKIVKDIYGDFYQNLNSSKIEEAIMEEREKFLLTLERGIKEFEKISEKKRISGKEAFYLYETFGFPFELTKELAEEKGIKVSEKEFLSAFKKHRQISKLGMERIFKGGLAGTSKEEIKYHTATHLLLAALRQILGPHITQKGSNITKERLRLDFSHPQKLTKEELQRVEDLVNEKIKANLPVVCQEMSLEEAKSKGALGVFEDKYGEKVKVYMIDDFSKEICGGPHVKNTGELGRFKIKKEESSSAGVRRIKAVLE